MGHGTGSSHRLRRLAAARANRRVTSRRRLACKGLEILGISVSDNKKKLKNFAKSFAVDYPLLYGGAKEMNKIMKDYGGVYAVPSSFLVGKNGNIVWSYPGAILKNYDPQTFATLVYEIEKELKKGEVENPLDE